MADLLGLAFLSAYHLYLRRAYRHAPQRTYRGHSNRLRTAWVETVRAGGKDILAVQTLRNWVMSATLFASTAIVIGLGSVSIAMEGPDLSGLSQALSLWPTGHAMVRVKLLLLAVIFFLSFLQFTLALRYYNQAGFLINLPQPYLDEPGAEPVADTLNHAAGHYNRGIRGFLLSTPFVLWLIGPDWFLAGVLATLLLLRSYDFRRVISIRRG
jgi:uncharacterized membrane protein